MNIFKNSRVLIIYYKKIKQQKLILEWIPEVGFNEDIIKTPSETSIKSLELFNKHF